MSLHWRIPLVPPIRFVCVRTMSLGASGAPLYVPLGFYFVHQLSLYKSSPSNCSLAQYPTSTPTSCLRLIQVTSRSFPFPVSDKNKIETHLCRYGAWSVGSLSQKGCALLSGQGTRRQPQRETAKQVATLSISGDHVERVTIHLTEK